MKLIAIFFTNYINYESIESQKINSSIKIDEFHENPARILIYFRKQIMKTEI